MQALRLRLVYDGAQNTFHDSTSFEFKILIVPSMAVSHRIRLATQSVNALHSRLGVSGRSTFSLLQKYSLVAPRCHYGVFTATTTAVEARVVIVRHKSSTPLAALTSQRAEEEYNGSIVSSDRKSISSAEGASESITPFLLSDIGEGIAEVELLQWFVRAGDEIVQFDRLCEVQSDKATVEITSRFDGKIVHLCGNAGDMIKVGHPLMHIDVDGESVCIASASTEAIAPETVVDSVQITPVFSDGAQNAVSLHNINDEEDMLQIPSSTGSLRPAHVNGVSAKPISKTKVQTTPAVRKIAKENNIDLRKIVGTGANGRVLKLDLLNHLNAEDQPNRFNQTVQSEENGNKAILDSPHDKIEPIRGIARLMVKSMTLSLQVPHFSYADEVTMDNLKIVRENLKPVVEAEGLRLTFMPFAIKAASIALKQYSKINCTFDDNNMTLIYHQDHNIGVAMDTSRGLVVPVIRACQNLSIFEITRELNRLQRAVSDILHFIPPLRYLSIRHGLYQIIFTSFSFWVGCRWEIN